MNSSMDTLREIAGLQRLPWSSQLKQITMHHTAKWYWFRENGRPFETPPTYEQIRPDLDAKLKADETGEVHGRVWKVLIDIFGDWIQERPLADWKPGTSSMVIMMFAITDGPAPELGRGATRAAARLAALDYAHAKGLLK